MTRAAIAAALEVEDETEALILASKRDPLRGAPLVLRNSLGEEVEVIEPGEWRNKGLADRLTGLPPFCPVTPLGSDGENFFFLNTLGQVHVLRGTIGKTQIDALFQGRGGYLDWAWPKWKAGRGKQGPTVSGYEGDEVRRDLFAACAYKGTFELEDRVRGRGAWRGPDGSLVYHAGNAVWIDGHWHPPGEIGRYIYPSRPKLARPALRYEKEGEGSPGDCLLKVLETFNWDRKKLDPRLALGWMVTARIGGALQRRPVIFVVGEEGSGKSTLQEVLRLGMNHALLATSNTTQAGIYQRVRQDSIAICVDEMEAKEDTRTVDKIIELARIAYSGDKMQRGGKDGDAKEFALMSSFMGSSIALPAMGAQDASRMAVMMMRPLERAGTDAPFEAADIELWGAQLLKRAFDWFSRWDELLKTFRAHLISIGHDSRSADTFGALAAGYHVAMRDTTPTAEDLAEWSTLLKADELEETSSKQRTWQRCFMVMLQVQPDVWRNTSVKSIGAVLERFRDGPDNADDATRHLSAVGMAISWAQDKPQVWDTARLFVPASNPGLHDLFEGTPWAGRVGDTGPWAQVLRQMPQHLWASGKCGKGLGKKGSGIFINIKDALEA